MKRLLGRKAKLYYNSATYESPTWVQITTRDTLAVGLTKTTEDVTGDDSNGEVWEQTILTARSLEFEAFQNDDNTDMADLDALKAAFEADTPIEFAVADGPIATVGTKYRRLPDLLLHEAGEGYDVKGVSKLKIVAKPGPSANAPSTVTVSA